MFSELRLELSEEKSGPVTGDLKFLGIRINQEGLWSETRSGTKVLLSDKDL